MKIRPEKLVKILEMTSLKYRIDPLKVDFESDGIYVRQTDSASMFATYAKIPTTIAQNYEPIGSVTLMGSQLKAIKEMFKADEYVEVKSEGESFIILGRDETYRLSKLSEKVNSLETQLLTKPYGVILQKPKFHKAFNLDISVMDVKYEDVIMLEYSGDKLIVHTQISGAPYSKTITPSKMEGNIDGKVTVEGDLLSDIVMLLKDIAWLVFTDGPLHVCYTNEIIPISITYMIAPRVEQ
jgi:hypothetical protein